MALRRDLDDGHPRPHRQDRRQFAVAVRIEVDDDDEGHSDAVRQGREEFLERAHAPGRRPDRGDRQTGVRCLLPERVPIQRAESSTKSAISVTDTNPPRRHPQYH